MASKKELLGQEVARPLAQAKLVALETVDFNDPESPQNLLGGRLSILARQSGCERSRETRGKPIYQMSKWWARRRSSVFPFDANRGGN